MDEKLLATTTPRRGRLATTPLAWQARNSQPATRNPQPATKKPQVSGLASQVFHLASFNYFWRKRELMLIDTHAHLYAKAFDGDREAMLERAAAEGVIRFYLPNVDRESIAAMLSLEEAHPDRCFAMMGVHPCSVKENYREELAVVEAWLSKRPFCAIGEIGIDLYWDKTHVAEQQAAFKIQLNWAKDLGIPVVIHSRESTEMILEILKEEQDGRLKGILHCFTGTAEQGSAAIDINFLLGIGGVLTYKNSGLAETVVQLPVSKLVLETDAPYLSPVPHRGKRNESSYLRMIINKLSEVTGVAVTELEQITTQNALVLFGHQNDLAD